MIFTSKRKFWKRRFAILPIVVNDGPERTVIWLEWVWMRNCGYYQEIALVNPEADNFDPLGEDRPHD